MKQAYFKYVPLQYSVPIVAVLFLLFQLHSMIKASRAKRIMERIDEGLVAELSKEEDVAKAKQESKAAKKGKKASDKLRQRLAAEKKATASAGASSGATPEDDDEAILLTFAKGKGIKKNK
jgi:hypothetical protein